MSEQRLSKPYVAYLLLLISVVVGMVFSADLISHHLNPAAASGLYESVCGAGSGSCAKVNQSGLSKLFGMPIAFWGFLFYATVIALAVVQFIWPARYLIVLLVIMAITGLLVDAILLIYSVAIVGTVCKMCAITYGATVIMALAIWMLYKKYKSQLKDVSMIKSFLNQTVFTRGSLALALTLALVGSVTVYCDSKDKAEAAVANDNSPQGMLGRAVQAFIEQYDKTEPVTMDISTSEKKGTEKDPVLTIVEFADYLCPHCSIAGQRLDSFVKKYGPYVQVNFRYYPLDKTCNPAMQRQMHAGACELSLASHCSGKQGKFWPMHDAIFNHMDYFYKNNVTMAQIKKIAQNNGVNVAQMTACMNTQAARAAVSKDIAEANRLGITGTPTIYVNNRKVQIHLDFLDSFLTTLLKKEYKKKTGRDFTE